MLLLNSYVFLIHVVIPPECSTAINKIEVARRGLEELQISLMVASLFGENVITIEEKRVMDDKMLLPIDKVTYFLDKILIPSLEGGDVKKFHVFCEVLEEKGEKVLARRLGLLIYCYLCKFWRTVLYKKNSL